MERSPVLVAVRRLRRTYGTPPVEVVALDGVDLDVRCGEILAVVGPSGSGKSTLLSVIGGLESPTAGEVRLDGTDLWSLDAAALAAVRRRHVGYVFQELNLLSGLTAAENVAAPLELDGAPARTARRQAVDGLGRVGLVDRADAFPDDLSGGERQRVAIARALIGNRRFLLADEPTGALDTATGNQIMALLREACTPTTAVVIVTHDADLAAAADRVAALRDGQLESVRDRVAAR